MIGCQNLERFALRDYEGRVASSVSLSASDRLGEAALEEIETKKYEELFELTWLRMGAITDGLTWKWKKRHEICIFLPQSRLVTTKKQLNVACHVYWR